MKTSIAVYLELGKKRVFVASVEWPGWCRSGRDAESALEALLEYGPRYAKAIKSARLGFKVPSHTEAFKIVEKLKGNATTDFGAPGIAPKADARGLDAKELKRQEAILKACWTALDRAAAKAKGATLSTGPRGGGRSLTKIVAHALDAEGAYLHALGGKYRGTDAKVMHETVLAMLESRARGEEPDMSRRKAPLWHPRYAVRRSAWHALDHAWEIEDRAGRGTGRTRRT
jgi:hypothetical protein